MNNIYPQHLEWRAISPKIEDAIFKAQLAWIGTRYSAHQREIGCGASCYGLMAAIYDTLYKHAAPTELPLMAPCVGSCNNGGWEMVRAFRKAFPLEEANGSVEPGDLIVTRSFGGKNGPDWPGHVMMASKSIGQVIHTLPASGAVWASMASSTGRIVKIYRPQRKETW